jgi:hypothetical protein
MRGGNIFNDDILNKILSIGFEMETHDLIKFNQFDNYLINSGLAGKLYKEKTLGRFVTPNYFLSNISKLPEVENTYENIEFVGGEKNRQHEMFPEYVYQTIDNPDMNLQVTNDVGETEFNRMIEEDCSKKKITKNKLYLIKTEKHIYNVGFTDFIKNQKCGLFSGVEFVSTHYKINQNTYSILNSLKKTIDELKIHFSDLKKEKCNLYVFKNKNKYKKIGNLDYRRIYFKPNTNLVYLDSYDYKYTMKTQSFNDMHFVIQMTFGVKSWDCMDVMVKMMSVKYENSKNKQLLNQIIISENQKIKVKKTIELLIQNYNKKSTQQITDEIKWRKIMGALYCILLKIDTYLNIYLEVDKDEKDTDAMSLKNYSHFQVRHSSTALIKYMYKVYHEEHNGNNIIEFLKKFIDPKILIETKFFMKKRLEEKVGEDKLVNFFNWYLDTFKDYDDPNKYSPDWFFKSELDHLTESMPIVDDVFLIENRQFNVMLILYLKNVMKLNVGSEISLKNLYAFSENLINTKKTTTKRNLSKSKQNKTKKN